MAEIKKFSMLELVNEIPCPDEMLDVKDNFVQMENVVDKEIEIVAFTFTISKDLKKYNQGNEKGVHIKFKDGDKTLRTATHSKRIVRGFEALEKAAETRVLEIPLPTMIVKVKTKDGFEMYDFKF